MAASPDGSWEIAVRETLQTPRLELTLPTLEDVNDLHDLFADPATMTVADGPHPRPSRP